MELENGLIHAVESGATEQGNSGANLHPLEMEMIVEKILSVLDFSSLRCARQVNKLFSSEGTKILFKRHFIRLPREIDELKNKKERRKLRQHFRKFLSYNSFKIPHLSIHAVEDVALLTSLKVVPHKVQSLRWPEWSLDKEEPKDQLNELLYQLPNLNYLDILQTTISSLAKTVLLDFCVATKKTLKENQKPLVLSRYQISYYGSLEEFKKFEKLAQCEGVKIQDLHVGVVLILDDHPHLQKRMIQIINGLISQSRQHLTSLRLGDCAKYLSHLCFPQMPKLCKLDLAFFVNMTPELEWVCAFDPLFKFTEATPNLKEIGLSWFADQLEGVDVWTHLFESTGHAPLVQKLSYLDESPGCNIDKLIEILPNLEDFELIWQIGNFESAFQSLCKFGKNIKRLSFQVYHGRLVPKISDFDRIFTGFSQETVDRINGTKDEDEQFDVPDVELLRVFPSILDLKGLKNLSLCINFWGPRDENVQILSIAGEYALKLVPNVDVCIQISGKTPNVTLAAVKKLSQLPNVTVETICPNESNMQISFPEFFADLGQMQNLRFALSNHRYNVSSSCFLAFSYM